MFLAGGGQFLFQAFEFLPPIAFEVLDSVHPLFKKGTEVSFLPVLKLYFLLLLILPFLPVTILPFLPVTIDFALLLNFVGICSAVFFLFIYFLFIYFFFVFAFLFLLCFWQGEGSSCSKLSNSCRQ